METAYSWRMAYYVPHHHRPTTKDAAAEILKGPRPGPPLLLPRTDRHESSSIGHGAGTARLPPAPSVPTEM